MILKSFLEKTQKSGAQFYVRLSQIFESNQIIHDTWSAMAQDMEQQAAGLEALPRTLWKNLPEDTSPIIEALQSSLSAQKIGKQENHSLHGWFERMLMVEEPLIMKAYVPIIRRLRGESTDRTLEFYIMVKAHVARLLSLIQPFEGDPAILSRVTMLRDSFEHEVQAPAIVPAALRHASKVKPRVKASEKHSSKTRAAARVPRRVKSVKPLGNRKHVSKLTKPMVGKLELRRSRARG